jgi:hypothetical protein
LEEAVIELEKLAQAAVESARAFATSAGIAKSNWPPSLLE